MTEILDRHYYTELMKNGFYDKLFFMDKLFEDWNTLLDYGSADGFQTKLIAKFVNIYPNKKIFGYDEDKKMINAAINTGSLPGNVSFYDDLSVVKNADVIFLSSVTHEIHSYKSMQEIKEFWAMVFNPKRKYVIIRDMIHPSTMHLFNTKEAEAAVRKYCDSMNIVGELTRFENLFGSISRSEHLVHWMMKYLYANSPNWNREIAENYLAVNSDYLIPNSPHNYVPSNWTLDHKELYTLPFLQYRWRTDFGIRNFPITTHGKYIFRNKNI